jgi:site-specific DNA-methyltransferase (adenine-specific)
MPKPYYEHAGIQIFHGDCREILPGLDFDWISTDPPYGINHATNYRGRSKLALCKDYIPVHGDAEPFDPLWLIALNKPTLLWGANHYASLLPSESGWLVWDKERPHDLDQATAELAWTNFVKGVRVFRHLWHGMLRASKDAIVHPTQKPEALHKWCFALRWTPPGIVIDPYMGSASLLRAAKDVGRRAIGIEIEERYCEIAAQRLSQEVLFGVSP